MSKTVIGKLNKAANQFAAGEYTGFGIRLGEQYYDRKTKTKEWTNYSAVIFASQPAKIKFYQDVLVEGAIVAVSGDKLKIDEYEGKYSIEVLNAVLEYTHTPEGSAPQQSQPDNASDAPNPNADDGGFDDDIPFMRLGMEHFI